MRKSVDTSPAPARHRPWWLAGVVLVTAIAVAVGLRVVGSDDPAAGGSDPGGAADERGLPAQLAERVVAVLEQATPDEHADHGHHFDDQAQGIVCVARTYGFEPAAATTLTQVEVVYAHHMCAEYGPGLSWPGAIRASGPLVVELTSDPATVLLPEQALPDVEDAVHADRVRALLPAEYHEQALAGDGFDPALAEQLRTRFEAAA